MFEHTFLTQFLIILAMATLVAFAFERIRLPSILGYLLAGVIIGPHGFGWLPHARSIHELAELGVMLLMLTIGLEFSFDRLKGMKKIAVIGGSLQILISIGVGMFFAAWQGWELYLGFFLGSVAALSSTAIVLKYLIDRGELDTHYGRVAVSILIFQDLAVAPLMILTQGLGEPASFLVSSLWSALINTVILLGTVIALARFILPQGLRRIALVRSREIFFLMVVALSSGLVWLASRLGLSPAIGAFLAGFMFANTDFRHQLVGDIVPFRHLFVSIFFVSIGLLFDPGFVVKHFGMILAMVGLVLLLNFVLMTVIMLVFRYTLRVALATGLILSQIGEFSFLLIESAWTGQRISPFLYQTLLSVAFITMFATPFLFASLPFILGISERIPLFGFPPTQWKKKENEADPLKDHIILCGFGPPGRDLAAAFKQEKISFVVIDMNPANVDRARRHGARVIYGDATNEEVMLRAGIEKARSVIISFGDSVGMAQIVRVVGRLNSDATVVARTRFEEDVARLYELGADMVVMEELEASMELNRVVLRHVGIREENIQTHLEHIRNRKELAVEEAILKRSRPEKK